MFIEKHVRPGCELDKIRLQCIILWHTAISPLVGFVPFTFAIPFVHVHASVFIYSRPLLFILPVIPFVIVDEPREIKVKNKHAGKYDAAEFFEPSKSFAPGALNEEELSLTRLTRRHAVEN